jgi:hypothetical protein
MQKPLVCGACVAVAAQISWWLWWWSVLVSGVPIHWHLICSVSLAVRQIGGKIIFFYTPGKSCKI